MIRIVLILILVIGAAIALVLDVGGIQDKLLGIFGIKDAEETIVQKSPEQIALEQEREAINNEKAELEALKSKLEKLKKELDVREDELNQKEEELLQQKQAVEELESKLSLELKNLGDLIQIYEDMESEQAAAIISQIDDQAQVVQIFKNMKKEKAAEILGLMDPKKAAQILIEMQ